MKKIAMLMMAAVMGGAVMTGAAFAKTAPSARSTKPTITQNMKKSEAKLFKKKHHKKHDGAKTGKK